MEYFTASATCYQIPHKAERVINDFVLDCRGNVLTAMWPVLQVSGCTTPSTIINAIGTIRVSEINWPPLELFSLTHIYGLKIFTVVVYIL